VCSLARAVDELAELESDYTGRTKNQEGEQEFAGTFERRLKIQIGSDLVR
jgi:hypothetical protein